MLFQEEHIADIRAGEKTETRRDWAEGYHRPEPGDIRMATTAMFTTDDECDCYIRVTDHYQERLDELDAVAADAEGGYTVDEFRDLWADINGAWEPDLVVDVVEFEYIGRSRPGGDA
jgi:uncharacterized protein YqfB (UPF0267 family)